MYTYSIDYFISIRFIAFHFFCACVCLLPRRRSKPPAWAPSLNVRLQCVCWLPWREEEGNSDWDGGSERAPAFLAPGDTPCGQADHHLFPVPATASERADPEGLPGER